MAELCKEIVDFTCGTCKLFRAFNAFAAFRSCVNPIITLSITTVMSTAAVFPPSACPSTESATTAAMQRMMTIKSCHFYQYLSFLRGENESFRGRLPSSVRPTF